MKIIDCNGQPLNINDRVRHGTTASRTTFYEGMAFEIKYEERITDRTQYGPKTYINPPQVYVLYDNGAIDHFDAWRTEPGTYQADDLERIE